jgi:hypothetical protein
VGFQAVLDFPGAAPGNLCLASPGRLATLIEWKCQREDELGYYVLTVAPELGRIAAIARSWLTLREATLGRGRSASELRLAGRITAQIEVCDLIAADPRRGPSLRGERVIVPWLGPRGSRQSSDDQSRCHNEQQAEGRGDCPRLTSRHRYLCLALHCDPRQHFLSRLDLPRRCPARPAYFPPSVIGGCAR